ncbi:MAG: pitrilysin family protein [Pseudomonadota bacterium]|nr:pitrilysin family protein [Pseudomonadota bacterium]
MLLLLALQSSAAFAQDIPFERYDLPNGLQVILHEDHSLPQVVVDIWYQVGSKDESPGRSGFAHLFEHLMFMGTDRLPGSGFDQVMEAYGGSNNAWTMEDATNYFEVGPPNLLSTFLWMEADRMEALGKAMTQEKVDLQREVVRNERRQSYEDEPYGVAWLEVPTLLYPAGHPYAHTVIGSHEDLQAASLQDVKDFFATWYVPNNASLVVAGDFDSAAVKPLIEKYFGHIPARELPARPNPAVVAAPQKTAPVEVADQVQFPQVNLFWHTPAAYAEGDAELQLVASLLGEGESSRLYESLVVEGLAQEVAVLQSPTQLGSTFIVSATAMEGVTPARLEAAILEELAALAAKAPGASEMARLKNQFEYGFLSSLESLLQRATQLNEYDAYTGSPDYLAKDLARFRGATAEGLSKATATYLKPDLAGRIVVRPEATEAK